MDNLKDEMNATHLAGQQQGPGKRIAAESNREYILQKTPVKPEPPARLGECPVSEAEIWSQIDFITQMLISPYKLITSPCGG